MKTISTRTSSNNDTIIEHVLQTVGGKYPYTFKVTIDKTEHATGIVTKQQIISSYSYAGHINRKFYQWLTQIREQERTGYYDK